MKQGTTVYRVHVTIEWGDGRVEFRCWRGGSVRRIHVAARKAYAGARVQFGTAIGVNAYGAH